METRGKRGDRKDCLVIEITLRCFCKDPSSVPKTQVPKLTGLLGTQWSHLSSVGGCTHMHIPPHRDTRMHKI